MMRQCPSSGGYDHRCHYKLHRQREAKQGDIRAAMPPFGDDRMTSDAEFEAPESNQAARVQAYLGTDAMLFNPVIREVHSA